MDEIPDINVFTEPTIDVNAVVAAQTLEVLAQTPGALATLTAEAFAAGVAGSGESLPPGPTTGPLPTFTFPPDAGRQPTPAATGSVPSSPEGGVPPIIPIIALGALGSLGLVVGMLRRMG